MSDAEVVVKKYKGRPKGATSLTTVKLSDLIKRFEGQPDVEVTVGRVWLGKITAVPAAVETDVAPAVETPAPVEATEAPKADEALVTVVENPQ